MSFDLSDPLADMDALYYEAEEEHLRGDEWATVAMRLIEKYYVDKDGNKKTPRV